MAEHFRRLLDVERVSNQLGLDLSKFVNIYQRSEQDKGGLQVSGRSEGSISWEAKENPSQHFLIQYGS